MHSSNAQNNPILTPSASAFIRDLMSDGHQTLESIVRYNGSPCHIIIPGAFRARVQEFNAAFRNVGIDGRLFFAAKANKADTILTEAARQRIGVDVSSKPEFVAALAAGSPASRLVVTGPHKGSALLKLAATHGSTVIVNDTAELRDWIDGHKRAMVDSPLSILLRIKPVKENSSRFGIAVEDANEAINIASRNGNAVRLLGFSVHLSGYDLKDRAAAGALLANFVACARAFGVDANWIDLGGGWPVAYVSQDSWREFENNLRASHFHSARTFRGFYPYHSAHSGASALAQCLATRVDGTLTLAELTRRDDLTLSVQPGRALLDQAGLSLFKVRGYQPTNLGYGIVVVDGYSFSLSEQWFGSEFLPHPLLLPSGPRALNHTEAAVAGSSCLEEDMLSWRKLVFAYRPMCGDILAYINTAGYQMDSNESEFHRVSLPRKVAMWSGHRGELCWCADEQFPDLEHPACIEGGEDDCHQTDHRMDWSYAVASNGGS